MSDQIINFYLTPAIQKRLPKHKDLQLEHTGMKIDSRILLAGASGTGKTNALMNYLYRTSKPKNGTFDHIFLCFKLSEVLYDELIDQCKDRISVYRSLDKFPDCDQFPDQTKLKYLVIFDDVVNDKDTASIKKINEYFSYSRKKGITTMFLSQSYFDTSTFVRKNVNYIMVLSINGKRDLESILQEQNMEGTDIDELKHIYKLCTKPQDDNDMPFMKITCGSKCDKNHKFSRNFLGYVNITDEHKP